ncbi:intermembrane phospholipid transport protein YdbH family protein [Halopseudomonas salina]|uniref:Dicarboxylate transport n=1 Tax=Halopseudomonas salina TaxID=1323744 RepID=A0ABQ1P7L0_9GAMM|nr:YdbH domain-containing protein [Halopseudomonas salina]GGC92752.1 hypothetical protein GCM10007418_10340 [Halopseudomonas salina]
MRLGVRLLAVLVVLLLALAFAAVLLMQQRLTAAGIDQFDWAGVGWSDGGLQLERVAGRYTDASGAQLQIHARALRIAPAWSGGPRLAAFQADHLQLEWQPTAAPSTSRTLSMPDVQQLAATLQWLPSRVLAIEQLAMSVPCGERRCTLEGAVTIEREAAAGFLVDLALLAEEGGVHLHGYLNSDTEGLQADLTLRLADQQAAELQAEWLYGESSVPRSQGTLTVPEWPQADWLLTYVEPWLGGAQLPVGSLPTGLRGEIRWLMAPTKPPQTLADMLSGAVELYAAATLADAWQIPDLGEVQGELTLDLLGDAGLWQFREGTGLLMLEALTVPALATLPAQVRPRAINLSVEAQADSQLAWTSHLPLVIQLEVAGPLTAQLAGPVTIASLPEWQAQWDAMRLRVEVPNYQLDALDLDQLMFDGNISGRLDAHELALELGSGAMVTLGRVRLQDMFVLTDVRADLAGLALQALLADPAAVAANGPVSIRAGRVEHAMLKPQGWILQGTLARDNAGLRWQGTAASASELGLALGFNWPVSEPWRADVKLESTFLRAGDPLSATLALWPELLTLGSGRLQGEVSLRGNPAMEHANGHLTLDNAAGIYDRATFQSLSTRINIDLAGDRLQLDMPTLMLAALDPGIAMGPLSADLHYSAHMDRVGAGLLRIEQAQLDVLGGQVRLEPAVLDLTEQRHAMMVDISGLELDRLFEVYPAEGLRGGGTLDGRLPLTLVDGALVIEEGQLGAREPGGFLQYRSAKLEDLAESTPGMRQVALALDDFHYDLLNADVTYGEGGILVLGLELQGRNPALQDGRPIHLNIRLEEDIPALLASLQLSGKVSEIIQERVRQRLLKQPADP